MGLINVQTIVACTGAILAFCLIVIRNSSGLVTYYIIYGFSAGAFMGLPAAGVVNLSADKSKIGARLGMSLAVVGCGVLVSNPIAGAILGGRGGWVGLIVWCGALLMASFISMAASRIWKLFKHIIQEGHVTSARLVELSGAILRPLAAAVHLVEEVDSRTWKATRVTEAMTTEEEITAGHRMM
ncbi:hypothetical protein RJZ90_006622 [Blastomyces dermatitidis]